MAEKKTLIVKIGNNERPARLSFAHLAQPGEGTDGKPGSYGALFIMEPDHESVAAIKKAMVQAAKDKWPSQYEAVLKTMKAGNKLCLKDGELKAEYDGFDGMVYVSANNKTKPKVYNQLAKEVREGDDGFPYNGCHVIASVDVWVQDHAKYGKRINASLRGVQFHSDGEAFGGGQVANADEFEALASGASQEVDFDDDDGFYGSNDLV